MTGFPVGDVVRARVAIVDDDTALREGIAAPLPGVEVVATCRSVTELLTRLHEPGNIDVAILDPNLNGGTATMQPQGRRAVAMATDAGLPVLIYTNERRRVVLVGCFLVGARGIVHKTEPMCSLSEGIQSVREGRTVVTASVAGLLDTMAKAGRLPVLTERQAEVLHGRARGETFAAIGRRLHISPRTAEEYVGVVVAKVRGVATAATPAELERLLGLAPGDLMD